MNSFKSFYQDIFHVNKSTFNGLALDVFKYQAENNPVYQKYLANLRVDINKVKTIDQIPFLPISFFKSHDIKTGLWANEAVFESSGTTGQQTSKHYIRSKAFYLENTKRIFNHFYGELENYHFLALLPSYLERENSSLVLMADYFIKNSKSAYSGFYLEDHDHLLSSLRQIDDNRNILLLGVSFALLDLMEENPPVLDNLIVMETGGMKGRRREMIRGELHKVLSSGFGINKIHSEYGMTELLSQAYSKGEGVFECPPWMRIMLRDINDPFDLSGKRSSGGINVIDLANIDSCAFIETQDLGKMHGDEGLFEVMGRFDNSDIRGCNLMVF